MDVESDADVPFGLFCDPHECFLKCQLAVFERSRDGEWHEAGFALHMMHTACKTRNVKIPNVWAHTKCEALAYVLRMTTCTL